MVTPSTIDCRLLCASACAYYVNLAGNFVAPNPLDPDYPLYVKAGFTGHVQAFTNKETVTELKINAAILADTDVGHVLAFRGTIPFKTYNCASWEDWIQDLTESETVKGDDLPGRVHKGMHDAFTSIWPDIHQALKYIYKTLKSTKPLLITGHSKGGPMASYAAYIIKNLGFPLARVTTFASPHPGNGTFATAYNKLLYQTRYENYLDLVPLLPPGPVGTDTILLFIDGLIDFLEWSFPSFKPELQKFETWINGAAKWDYQPVGTLKYITQYDVIVGDSVGLIYIRIDEMINVIYEDGIESGLKQIADAHTIRCGGGYQKGVCPGTCGN